MSNKQILTNASVDVLARDAAARIARKFPDRREVAVYPVPRGGVPAAYALARQWGRATIVDSPTQADLIFDDLIDSGATQEQYAIDFPKTPFDALIDKRVGDHGWIVFPWEADVERSAEDIFTRLLQFIGEDPKRGGLLETPRRVAKAWEAWTAGYHQDPAAVLKTFEDGAEGADEMVVVKDIPFYSHCEHHLAPFFGTATIGYIPSGKVVGLSKLSRVTNIFAKRLQVQERLTNQIADALVSHLAPAGVGVVLRARHMCMESRGVCQQGHSTVTSALRGAMREQAATRAEFLSLARA